MDSKKIEQMFEYHPSTGDKPGIQGALRFTCLQLARLIMNAIPNCYEREEAIRKLNEVLFWAGAGIDRCKFDDSAEIQKANKMGPVDTKSDLPSGSCD